MTLAAILFICCFWSVSVPNRPSASAGNQSTGLQESATKSQESSPPQTPSNTPGTQTQTAPSSQTQPPSATPPASQATGQKKPATSRRKRPTRKSISEKKSAEAPDCNKSAAANSPPAAATPSANSTGAAAATPTNCPPPKIVIREGGTSEPAIQLLGDADEAADSHQRATTDQLLGSAVNNLKKAEGRQLNSSQQEMVTQIRQFMEQSKAAVAAGDVQRGRTLALKAHLLSDELVKP